MFGMFQKTGLVITASRVAVFSTPPAPAQGVLPGSAGSQLLHPPPCLAPRCGEVSLLGGRVVTSVAARVRLPRVCRSLADSCPEIIFTSGHLRGARQ